MALEKCKNCGGILILIANRWQHDTSAYRTSCGNGEPGMGLSETIEAYWKLPLVYATWALPLVNDYTYTLNAILHGLQMQATIHWNNCAISKCGNCLELGRETANRYTRELANGRHDLHPKDDQEVHMIAFDIHNAETSIHPAHGRSGIMTCTYAINGGNAACSCYERGYKAWLALTAQKAKQVLITIDPDDMHYEPRYE